MFTGIVQSKGQIISINQQNKLITARVCVDKSLIERLEVGASVANNGVCLTAVKFSLLTKEASNGKAFIDFDIIDETLRVTNLGQLLVGDEVNLERSMKVGDEIGGHIVSGHIHCQAELIKREQTATNCQLTFVCDNQWSKYILSKGFMAINGISLTLGEVIDGQFSVHLIPETLARTNLNQLGIGGKVNIEFDQQTITIVETIERLQQQQKLL